MNATDRKADSYEAIPDKTDSGEARDAAGEPGRVRLEQIKGRTVPGGPEGDCWMWTGPQDGGGYGHTRFGGPHKVGVHRAAWEAANGRPVPPGLVVRHRCHTPACVNPGHLMAGTQRENIADSVAAGRTARGEKNGRSVLRNRDPAVIRRMAAAGSSHAAIARLFGVHPTTVRDIVRFRIWTYSV